MLMQLYDLYMDYIKPELFIVTPVLYIMAKMMKNSNMNDKKIPWYLLIVSVLLASLYVFATTDISNLPKFLMALFTTIIQGVLLSGTTVFGGILGGLVKNRNV